MKKFNDNRNVIGNLIKEHREKKHYSKMELSRKLELLGIELDRFELYKIETSKKSVKDFEYLHKLNGKKILLKGNHDYWWTTMNKLREFTAEHGFDDIEFLQNNSFMY